jgi:hypothetical protein
MLQAKQVTDGLIQGGPRRLRRGGAHGGGLSHGHVALTTGAP